MTDQITLAPDTNQALGLARYANEFMAGGEPSPPVLARTNRFYTDACLCGLSALALGTNAPTILRSEALGYPAGAEPGATVFGSSVPVKAEKAILANSSAVREWDSNGTNFGFRPELGHTAGEFGHNDFYAVPIAAAQIKGLDGAAALKGMVLLDEIRGRLAEVFSLKTYKIDHVVHGAIASAATFGAMLGATPEQIESAIGMVVAHSIPFRAIRAGKQLSDSKGASAAISTEAAILSVKRSMGGFLGPRDIFRNPEAIFRLFEGPGEMLTTAKRAVAGWKPSPPGDASPFELVLSRTGDDFTVMGMHFKLGLYEHQSAGALQAAIDLVAAHPTLLEPGAIKSIRIAAYEPAFGIIGDPAKKDPRTRQSADHSMAYIVATLLRKAIESRPDFPADPAGSNTDWWKTLILEPHDYAPGAINNAATRDLMAKIEFVHGGSEYDARYPDGIPTSMVITAADGVEHDSGLVMYPGGHARNTTARLDEILANKSRVLGAIAFDDPAPVIARFDNLGAKSAGDVAGIHDFTFKTHGTFE